MKYRESKQPVAMGFQKCAHCGEETWCLYDIQQDKCFCSDECKATEARAVRG